jgi:hypothetical protein
MWVVTTSFPQYTCHNPEDLDYHDSLYYPNNFMLTNLLIYLLTYLLTYYLAMIAQSV